MSDNTQAELEQIEALKTAREAIDRALALLGADTTIDSGTSTPVDEPDWRMLKDAARICGIHPDTMARQARANGLGRRIDGGAWRIDMRRVSAWQEGRPYARLPQGMSEHTDRCGNTSDAGDVGTAAYLPAAKDKT